MQGSRGRFPVEQYFHRSKTDLGLDHYVGRSWAGFHHHHHHHHHHLVLAAVAYVFIMVVYLRSKKTAGATWEKVLHAIQSWLVRLIGCCTCCQMRNSITKLLLNRKHKSWSIFPSKIAVNHCTTKCFDDV